VTITAIVTAFKRVSQAIETLRKIRKCNPAPEEIIVHVDGNELSCADAVEKEFPELKVILSKENIGPGGGRNKLVAAARNEVIASFDDDSYPIDSDFFARSLSLAERFPQAAVIGCSIFHRGEALQAAKPEIFRAWNFTGCGVLYRRRAFLDAGGYIPLPHAYGMEEEDLSLRLLDLGRVLLYSPWLRVYHDTDLAHHCDERITAAQIANGALLAFLRYPKRYWPYGVAQVSNRVFWSISHQRRKGVAAGLLQIPRLLMRHRKLRSPVSGRTIKVKRNGSAEGPRFMTHHGQAMMLPHESAS
jgi:GT2 family glycosyltransferase